MAIERGMLGELFGAPTRKDLLAEEQYEDERLRSLAGDGIKGADYASLMGAQMAGQGLGAAVASAAGRDPRSDTQKTLDGVRAAKEQVAALGIDPNDTDAYYKAVIDILRKNGLHNQAHAVAQEWDAKKKEAHRQKIADEKLVLERDELQLKRDKAYMADALGWARIEALQKKGLNPKAASQIGKMIADMEALPPGHAGRAQLKAAIENASASKVIVEDLGNKIRLRDATTKEVLADDEKGLNPNAQTKKDKADDHDKWAYTEVKADMQRQINKAAELHNHPGRDGIGGIIGQRVGDKDVLGAAATVIKGPAAAAANELWNSITGGTLLTGLAKLKMASKTGASGLGALSEREGEKVQADAAALGRSQKGGDMALRLRQYIQTIVEGGARLDSKAREDGISPIMQLQVPALSNRGERASSTPPAPLAPKPVAAAPTSGLSPEKQKRLAELRAKRDAAKGK